MYYCIQNITTVQIVRYFCSVVARSYPTEWLYDEYTNEIDGLEEPKSPVDDEYDYDPRYGNKKRRKRRPATQKLQRSLNHTGETPRKGRQSGSASGSRRGRRKTTATDKNSSRYSIYSSVHHFQV